MKKALWLLVFGTFSTSWASGPALTNLSTSDLESIGREFSSNFSHASVMGAEPLGDIFGFEVSLVAGQNASPEIDKLAKKAGSTGLDKLYHAGILLGVSVPFGITGEIVATPKTTAGDVSFSQTSVAVKWTATKEVLAVLPFNLAIRAFSTNSSLDFNQTVSGVSSTVENKNKVTGYQFLISPDLPAIEPYLGVGFLSAKNTISTTVGSIFLPSVTAGQSYETSLNSTQTLLGVNAYLMFFSLGLEYAKAFDSDRYTAKLGFYF